MNSLITIYLALTLSMAGPQESPEEQSVRDLAGYTLSKLRLTNTGPLHSEFLRNVFPLREGDPYNAEQLRKTLGMIRQLYLELGYVDFAYNPQQDVDINERTISCTFEFIPGTLYHVNQIHIFGAGSDEAEENIRGALILKESGIFSLAALDRSIRRLNKLLEAQNLSLKKYEYTRSSEQPGLVDVSIWIQSGE